MKKVLALALGMLLIPFTAFGMQTLSVDEMAEITGQAGVAIALDDVKIFYTGGDEIWYQTSAANWQAINGEYQYYSASVGLITGGPEMMWANAMVPGKNGAVAAAQYGDLVSPGKRGLFVDYAAYAAEPYNFNFGNTGYYGTINLAASNMAGGWEAVWSSFSVSGTTLVPNVAAGANYQAIGVVVAGLKDLNKKEYRVAALGGTAANWTEAANAVAEAFPDAAGNGISYDLNDVAFDSRSLTIRVKDRLDTFSDATYYRLQSLALLSQVDTQLTAAAANGIVFTPAENMARGRDNWYTGSADFTSGGSNSHQAGFFASLNPFFAGNYTGTSPSLAQYQDKENVRIAGVEIGLPTVELAYQDRSDMEILISVNPIPSSLINRVRVTDVAGTVTYDDINTWSFGLLYFGGNSSTTILDGKIEITPIEAYANPTLFQDTINNFPPSP